MEHYKDDGYTNFIFVGRVAPNKKQEDVIRAFYCYKKYCNPKSRLFIVGSYNGMERYYHRLRRYVGALELDNVVFTGHIPFAQILAYYHLADLFLCMSDHEGFCVPLVEAMYFNLPFWHTIRPPFRTPWAAAAFCCPPTIPWRQPLPQTGCCGIRSCAVR